MSKAHYKDTYAPRAILLTTYPKRPDEDHPRPIEYGNGRKGKRALGVYKTAKQGKRWRQSWATVLPRRTRSIKNATKLRGAGESQTDV